MKSLVKYTITLQTLLAVVFFIACSHTINREEIKVKIFSQFNHVRMEVGYHTKGAIYPVQLKAEQFVRKALQARSI